jgi:hypothetical protein
MTTDALTHPLPFFRPLHRPWGVPAGVLDLTNIGRHAPVIHHGPMLHKTTHPFGHSTTVASLAADAVRR